MLKLRPGLNGMFELFFYAAGKTGQKKASSESRKRRPKRRQNKFEIKVYENAMKMLLPVFGVKY